MGAAGGASAECVINISEGRDAGTVATTAASGGDLVVDVHSDHEHNRTVLTLVGPLADVEEAARAVSAAAIAAIDLRGHQGVHPRLGAVDVVPFVPLAGPGGALTPWESVIGARDAFASWAGTTFDVPCFVYGPERTLPDIRRGAFTVLSPDTGPPSPHPTAGATAVGARTVLIAYNVWIAPAGDAAPPDDVAQVARSLASRIRRTELRTLGLAVDGGAQVSCNLVDPDAIALTDVFDDVARGAAEHGCTAIRGELVGLLPSSALAAAPKHRWAELGIGTEHTIEFRLGSGRC
ncbi:MAG: hypothetical protein ABSF84_17410 [Acidimicrobiales bacterium]